MKRAKLDLGGGMLIETGPDWNGRYYVAYRNGCSMFFRDVKLLRKFLSLPVKTDSRAKFDAWIAEVTAERPKLQQEGISPELAATGFGPEVHLDESDPNFKTRMVT